MVKYCEETEEFLFEEGKMKLKVTRDFLIERVQECHEEYSITKNPVHVWRAINLLPFLGERIPVWIQNYLTEVSANILKNSSAGDDFHKNNSKALGLTAKMVSENDKIDRDMKIKLTVMSYIESGRSKIESIEIAKQIFRVSQSTVDRAIKGLTKTKYSNVTGR